MMQKPAIIAIVLTALAAAAGAGFWYVKASEGPPECQFIAVSQSGYKKLTLEDLKGQLEMLQMPQLSMTPGIQDQVSKLRKCIARLEGTP